MQGRWARQLVVTVAVEADDPSVVGRVGSYFQEAVAAGAAGAAP